MVAIITPTNIPGLVDVQLTDGTTYQDLTVGQVRYLAHRDGWVIQSPQ